MHILILSQKLFYFLLIFFLLQVIMKKFIHKDIIYILVPPFDIANYYKRIVFIWGQFC